MIYYRITSKGTRNSLSVNPAHAGAGDQLFVTDDLSLDHSLWIVSFHESNEWNVGITLMNKATRMLAVPEFVGEGARVIQVSLPADCKIPDSYVWQTNVVGGVNDERSVSSLTNEKQAMTAIHHPNIITHKWSGGDAREVWKFKMICGAERW